jgi:exodeoxyribonuclease VII small subunit
MSPEGRTGGGVTNPGKDNSEPDSSGPASSAKGSSGPDSLGTASSASASSATASSATGRPEVPRTVGRAAFDPQLAGVSGPLESLTFEDLVGALERVAARLAGGDLGIEAAADLYEQAELLHGAAQERLSAVEARIERLSQPDQL